MSALVTRGVPRRGSPRARSAANALGWFSLGLGVVQLLFPGRVSRAIGLHDNEPLVAALGVREIGTGLGILSSTDKRPWLLGRVGGDSIDMAVLAGAADRDNPRRGSALAALLLVGGVTLLDAWTASALRKPVRGPRIDHGRRSGLPKPPGQMRGAARDFAIPADMQIPKAMRPWTTG